VTTTVLPEVPLGSFNLSDPQFWLEPRDYRDAAFKTLREQAPVYFEEEWGEADALVPKGAGYWSLTRYQDVWAASRNPKVYCSGQGITIMDVPIEIAEFLGSMIVMDDPRHHRMRSIVAKGFTPKEVTRVEAYVRTRAAAVIDRLLEEFPGRQCEFVEHVAARLPLNVIAEMMGIPAEDEQQLYAWTNVILGASDPEYGHSMEDVGIATSSMFAYAMALGEDRLANPGDDITSILMHAEVDGERLTAQEFGSFFILLVSAGNETTRNAIAHGLHLLTRHPDQREAWYSDFETHTKTAVEEIVRYSSPIINFRRTLTEDVELHGVPLSAGSKVVIWYNSANRDETVWDDPYTFDVRRPMQPAQVGFGAGGPHFCLGANLARREISVMFDEIRRRVPQLHTVGEPEYLESSFVNGIKRVQCAW
jgi:cytochrome P450